MNEIWISILNFEEYYNISNFGRVKSLKRNITDKNGISRMKKEKILKPHCSATGRKSIVLTIKGKKTRHNISDLFNNHFNKIDF